LSPIAYRTRKWIISWACRAISPQSARSFFFYFLCKLSVSMV